MEGKRIRNKDIFKESVKNIIFLRTCPKGGIRVPGHKRADETVFFFTNAVKRRKIMFLTAPSQSLSII